MNALSLKAAYCAEPKSLEVRSICLNLQVHSLKARP